jgi:hypothetical protein
MDYGDWLALGGSSAIRGGVFARPVNPRLLSQLVTKARPTKSAALAHQTRRLIYQAYQATGEIDAALPHAASKRPVKDASLYAQSRPGAAGLRAQLRHMRAAQDARR